MMSPAILHTTAALSADEARAITDRIRRGVESVRSDLWEAKERKAWAALGYATFEEYVDSELNMTDRNARYLLNQESVIRQIAAATGNAFPVEIGVRAANEIKDAIPAVSEEIRERVESGEEPAAAVRAVVELKREERRVPHAGHEPEAEEDFAPDLAAELEHAHAEIDRLQALVDALSASDQGAEIARWADKFARLEGRLQAALREGSEAEKDAKYAKGMLAKIRSALRVERDSEILPALVAREAA